MSSASGCARRELSPRRRRGRDGREGGFTLAVLVMALAVLAIMMTVAYQEVSFSQRREKEEELIFRGQQYAEGIRLFRLKFGRYPMRLKELWEAKPRVVRKKWKDPITDSYDWGLVFLGQGGQRLAGGGAGDQATPTPGPATAGGPASDRPGAGFGLAAGEKVGPIIGVYSTSCDESIKVYEGHTQYCKWTFTYQEQQRAGGGRRPVPPRPTPTSPYPFGVKLPPMPETTPTPGG